MRRTFVAGVGVTKFSRPGSGTADYPELALRAGKAALQDAGIDYRSVDAVVASYCYGDSTSGQRAVYGLGLTGVPIFNVNNNCSSGSSALMLARTLVQSNRFKIVLALGFEVMEAGLSARYPEKSSPWQRHVDHMLNNAIPPNPVRPDIDKTTSDVIKMFAYAAREYMDQHKDVTMHDLAAIAHKNRVQGLSNPNCSLKKPTTLEAIEQKPMLCHPINIGMATPTADGAAAALVVSDRALSEIGTTHGCAVEITSQHMVTDLPTSFANSLMNLVGVKMAHEAARRCYDDAKVTPRNVDILELHDCFSCNELFMYEALGLAKPGEGVDLIRNAKWKTTPGGGRLCYLGGRWVVNPSGGLESKGHPIGATGLAQCHELVTQLRHEAEARQVPNAKIGLQHNFGLGSACVVTLYSRRELPVSNRELRWPKSSL